MANVGPTKWYVDSVAWTAVSAWSTPLTPAAGTLKRQSATPTVGNERVFVVIVSGAVGGAEPAWTVTKGAKTTDNAATWQECTGQPGVNGDTTNSPTWTQNKNTAVTLGLIIYDSVSLSLQIVSTAGTTGNGAQPTFSATAGTTTADNTVTWTSLGLASNFAGWAAPHARLGNATAGNWAVAGDTIFLASEHAETAAVATTPTFPGTLSNPNLAISVNKAGAVPPGGADYLAGASITTTGAVNIQISGSAKIVGVTLSADAQLQLNGSAGGWEHYLHCKLRVSNRANSGDALFPFFNQNSATKFEDTTVKFGHIGNKIQTNGSGNNGIWEWLNTASAIDNTGSVPTTLLNPNGTGINWFIHGVDLSVETGNLVDVSNGVPWTVTLSNLKINASATVKVNSFTLPSESLTLINVDSGATGYRNEWHNYYGDVTTETTITRSGGSSDYGPQNVSHKYISSANAAVSAPFVGPTLVTECLLSSGSHTATIEIISSQTLNNNDVWAEFEYEGSNASPLSSFVNDGLANPLSTAAAQTSSSATWRSSPPTPVTQKLQVTFTPAAPGNVTARVFVGKPSTTLYVDPVITIV